LKEELKIVKNIFYNKTNTLIQNEMVFKNYLLGMNVYNNPPTTTLFRKIRIFAYSNQHLLKRLEVVMNFNVLAIMLFTSLRKRKCGGEDAQ
jgi:magnesium-transporting ATPase (P-type)